MSEWRPIIHRIVNPSTRALRLLGVLLATALVVPSPCLSAAGSLAADALPDHACRLWGMIGSAPDPAVIDDQLVSGTQAFIELASSNPDGWGMAYYAPALWLPGLERPQLLRAGPPADDKFDLRYRDAVREMLDLDATCAIVHLRAASAGHRDEPDPHPFWRDGINLAHNGTMSTSILQALLTEDDPDYLEQHPPDYENLYIDSELFFLYVLKLRDAGVTREDGTRSHSLGDAVASAALRVYDRSGLISAANVLVSVPDTLFALRFDTSNHERYKLRYKSIPGAWVVASEPVGTDTTGWSSIPPKALGIFARGAVPAFRIVYPPTEAWLTVENTKIDDDTVPPSAGNGDADLDAGETVELRVNLKNVGGQTATTVSARLQSADTLAVITDSTCGYWSIPPGGIGQPLDPFVVQIRPECPSRHVLYFTFSVTAGLGGHPQTWTRSLTLPVYAPDIRFQAADVWDDQGGPMDPGDEGDLRLWLSNSGTEEATSLRATLRSDSPNLEILQGEAGTDTLAGGESDSLTPLYRLRVSAACPNPEIIPVVASTSADWDIRREIGFDIAVGGFQDNVEGGEGLWTHAVGIPGYLDQWHVSQLQDHTAGGSRSWKCGAADSGAVYAHYLDAILTSPVVPLALHSELRFWQFIRADVSHGHFGRALDGGIVEASINGGPWTQLYPTTGYDFIIEESYPPGPFPAGTPVFSGWWSWRQSICEIDGFTGTVQFRFRFGSDAEFGAEGWYIDDIQILGTNVSSDAPEPDTGPLAPALRVGGPNPFRESTAILYDVARAGPIELSILDLEGRVLRRLVRGAVDAGRHRIVWDGRDEAGRAVPSGLYFYRLQSRENNFEEVQRVIRVR